jgi:hypothetical protein
MFWPNRANVLQKVQLIFWFPAQKGFPKQILLYVLHFIARKSADTADFTVLNAVHGIPV